MHVHLFLLFFWTFEISKSVFHNCFHTECFKWFGHNTLYVFLSLLIAQIGNEKWMKKPTKSSNSFYADVYATNYHSKLYKKNIKMSHKSKAKQSDCVHPSDHLNHDAMIITRHFHTWKTRPAKLPSINSLYSIMLLKCLKAIPKDLCQHTANTDH